MVSSGKTKKYSFNKTCQTKCMHAQVIANVAVFPSCTPLGLLSSSYIYDAHARAHTHTHTHTRTRMYTHTHINMYIGKQGGERGMQVGSMNEESQVRVAIT